MTKTKSLKSQGKRLFEKRKLAKKPLRSLVSVTLKGKSSTSTLLEECSFQAPSSEIINRPPPYCSDLDETKKKVLLNWKQMKITKKREEALLKLDFIKNTAGFNDNMDSMRDFQNLIRGYSSSG
ncbi:unnamed protein product [Lupinus luteus]|uniref:Uncharacterized protein n=1 Tax=Lupinus luteus TaxID=3873 RepID=A0AAV1Y233_LUPLU